MSYESGKIALIARAKELADLARKHERQFAEEAFEEGVVPLFVDSLDMVIGILERTTSGSTK